MSAINRIVLKHRPVRWLVVALFMVLPGFFAFGIAWVDEWLDKREWNRR